MGKSISILTLALMASVSSIAQQAYKPDTNAVYRLVEKMPTYPGGDEGLMKYLATTKYPTIARENVWEGTVYIQFIINMEGEVSNASILGSSGYGLLDTTALKQVQCMPKWKPGMQDGKPVKVQYVVPIKFRWDGASPSPPTPPPPPPPPSTNPSERGQAAKRD